LHEKTWCGGELWMVSELLLFVVVPTNSQFNWVAHDLWESELITTEKTWWRWFLNRTAISVAIPTLLSIILFQSCWIG
jgi:hypothetical protein